MIRSSPLFRPHTHPSHPSLISLSFFHFDSSFYLFVRTQLVSHKRSTCLVVLRWLFPRARS